MSHRGATKSRRSHQEPPGAAEATRSHQEPQKPQKPPGEEGKKKIPPKKKNPKLNYPPIKNLWNSLESSSGFCECLFLHLQVCVRPFFAAGFFGAMLTCCKEQSNRSLATASLPGNSITHGEHVHTCSILGESHAMFLSQSSNEGMGDYQSIVSRWLPSAATVPVLRLQL